MAAGRLRLVEMLNGTGRTKPLSQDPRRRELLTQQVLEVSPSETELIVTTNAAVLGKLGEFGQPLMRKKGDSIMAEFARNVAKQVASSLDASATVRPGEERR